MITTLGEYEMQLVTDSNILITKNSIIRKVYEMFGGLSEDYKKLLQEVDLILPTEIGPKISRGENYNGLPYVILDYPRQFGKADVFAIRSFFWWGNFFSITVQLAGEYQQKWAVPLETAIGAGAFEGWSIGSAIDPWQHHFDADNYTPIHQHKTYGLSDLPFIKLAKKIPLNKWDEAEIFFSENFSFLINTLSASGANSM